ncbi:MAG: HD domain-containing protein [Candidatus Hydrogenedentes bacterium]|nr:HD domain-containing protein [Candidatus Hydrogenedentota bacterium]MBI3118167.1 HD domain-containing protein [Candidatus Hydrogenedentota bacterium]
MNDRNHEASLKVVRALARKLDDEPEHPFQVCKLALQLFDATVELHGLGRHERPLLEAAALLHDTGLRYGAQGHHKRSHEIVLAQDLPGFSEDEKAIIACVARYHRKSHPQPDHKTYRDLGRITQGIVRALAAILRIADGLDRSHAAAAQRLRVRIANGAVRIGVLQRQPNDLDIWGARRKQALFEEVFNVRVQIERIEDP